MRVLLDTCVLSELRRKKGHARVRSRVEGLRSRDLFLSVITVGELTKGIAMLRGGNKKDALVRWLQTLEQDYSHRILPVDTEIARIWGELAATAQGRGKTTSVSDGIIAATAIWHGLYVMTRNVNDFVDSGVMLINPWESA